MENNTKTIQSQLEQLIANFCESMAIAMPDCNVSISISNVDVADAEPLSEIVGLKKQYRCNSETGAMYSILQGSKFLDENYKNYLFLTTKQLSNEKCI